MNTMHFKKKNYPKILRPKLLLSRLIKLLRTRVVTLLVIKSGLLLLSGCIKI